MTTTTFRLSPQNISRVCLLFLVVAVIGAVLSIEFAGSMAGIFRRDLGSGIHFLPQWIALCDGYNPAHYPPRRCTFLIDCVYGKMTQVQVADTAIGGTIAGLLPTIPVLLGACFHPCSRRPPTYPYDTMRYRLIRCVCV